MAEDFNSDPLDALLADALQTSSASLPDDGFTARVSQCIEAQTWRQKLWRKLPWGLGGLAAVCLGATHPQALRLPALSVPSADLQVPLPHSPALMETVAAAAHYLNVGRPIVLLELAGAALIAFAVTSISSRQPDFRW